jgi:hypothetical protein
MYIIYKCGRGPQHGGSLVGDPCTRYLKISRKTAAYEEYLKSNNVQEAELLPGNIL